jgi:hypothetical protein
MSIPPPNSRYVVPPPPPNIFVYGLETLAPAPMFPVTYGEPIHQFLQKAMSELEVFVDVNWRTLMQYLTMAVSVLISQGSNLDAAVMQICSPLINKALDMIKQYALDAVVEFWETEMPALADIVSEMSAAVGEISESAQEVLDEIGELVTDVAQDLTDVVDVIQSEIDAQLTNPYIADIVTAISNPILAQLNNYVTSEINGLIGQVQSTLSLPGAITSSTTSSLLGRLNGQIKAVLPSNSISNPAVVDALKQIDVSINKHLNQNRPVT